MVVSRYRWIMAPLIHLFGTAAMCANFYGLGMSRLTINHAMSQRVAGIAVALWAVTMLLIIVHEWTRNSGERRR